MNDINAIHFFISIIVGQTQTSSIAKSNSPKAIPITATDQSWKNL